jgi:NAD(P)-dependent dehydrogenase (short-subunit alcohol dehydrogenase family)
MVASRSRSTAVTSLVLRKEIAFGVRQRAGAGDGRIFGTRGGDSRTIDPARCPRDNLRHSTSVGRHRGGFVRVDVTDAASVAAGLAAAESLCGVARVLFNCAGVSPAARIVNAEGEPHPLDLFRRVIDVNLIGTFNVMTLFCAKLAREGLRGEERGVIVNTASGAAFDGQIGQAAYSASKAGIAGLTLPAARDLADLAIRVVTIAPGLFTTPMLNALPERVQVSLLAQAPFPRRPGRPHEFAQLVEEIVRNPMLNGETIRLDGAIRMASR